MGDFGSINKKKNIRLFVYFNKFFFYIEVDIENVKVSPLGNALAFTAEVYPDLSKVLESSWNFQHEEREEKKEGRDNGFQY